MKTKLLIILSLGFAINAHAGSATWNLNPTNGDWHTAANWTPATVPNGSADFASFSVSNNTAVSLSASATVNGLIFNPGASAFTITANPTRLLNITGVGIANNSGITQNFSALSNENALFGMFIFSGSASAGDSNVFTNHGSKKPGFSSDGVLFTETSTAGTSTFINKADEVGPGAGVDFWNSSSADHGTFINESGNATGIFGGQIAFLHNSTAGNGTFILNGRQIAGTEGGRVVFFGTSTGANGTFWCEGAAVSGAGTGSFLQISGASTAGDGIFTADGGVVSGAAGAYILVVETATGGNATFTMNGGTVAGAGGGTLSFSQNSNGDHPTAGNATLIANGGLSGGAGGEISFTGGNGLLPDGGTARVALFGNGHLDLSQRAAGQALTIGSVEGDGIVFLGKVRLGVGIRNLDTVFSGLMQDGGAFGGSGGSLSKAGTGKLTLTGANSYTGGTTLNAGTLIASNKSGSATGTGTVQVKSGTLGGGGTIAGTVTIGSGGASFLAPADGRAKPATLTIGGGLTLENASTYTCTFRAKGNRKQNDQVIANGVTINSAMFSFQGTVQGALQNGTVFTVINNTSANPISGTFSNMADGAIVNVNGNNFQASYTGGDGNDLTLTVVP
jgi:fibronectin-binding autotransporter adhesin